MGQVPVAVEEPSFVVAFLLPDDDLLQVPTSSKTFPIMSDYNLLKILQIYCLDNERITLSCLELIAWLQWFEQMSSASVAMGTLDLQVHMCISTGVGL